jgi:hypothetical protein
MNSDLRFEPEELFEINLEVEQRRIGLTDPNRLRRRRAIPVVIALANEDYHGSSPFLRGD